jgi:hypothetical protein
MFRAGARRSESFHTFLVMGELSDLIGLQSGIWAADSELVGVISLCLPGQSDQSWTYITDLLSAELLCASDVL